MYPIIKEVCPPVIRKFVNRKFAKSGWFGKYHTWMDALKNSTGYDSKLILESVRNSTLKVKSGEFPCERDSVLFNEIQYSWPILSGLLKISIIHNNTLNIIDFGGSLGSSYYQNRFFLGKEINVNWNIVEQKDFVKCGNKLFKSKELKFYESIESCIEKEKSKVILLSSVLQYLENPYELIKQIISNQFEWILIDRTPFTNQNTDFITVQKVRPQIYPASYPCWIFNHNKFLQKFQNSYRLIAEFDSCDQANIPVYFKGFIFKKGTTDNEL